MSHLRFCRAILSRDSDARQSRRYDMALTDALEKDDFGMFEAMGPQVKGAIFV